MRFYHIRGLKRAKGTFSKKNKNKKKMEDTNYSNIFIPYNEFTSIRLIKEFTEALKFNTTYSIFVKIACNQNLVFKMCGSQIGLIIGETHDNEHYKNIYTLVANRIDNNLNNYFFLETVDTIEFIYTTIKTEPELKLKDIQNFPSNRQIIKNDKRYFNSIFLPLTLNFIYYGVEIVNPLTKKEIYNFINEKILIIPQENKNNIYIPNYNDKLFNYTSDNDNKNFIILCQFINEKLTIKHVFDSKTGFLILKATDNISNISTNMITFIRTIGSLSFTICENNFFNNKEEIWHDRKVMSFNQTLNLKPILPNPYKIEANDRDNRFGTLDLETFKDEDGISKVYALGFYTQIEPNINIFYLTEVKNFDSHLLVLNCIDAMLKTKYNNYIFYVHNLANFDVIFIHSVLLKANEEKGFDYYILDSTMRDDEMIKLNIKIRNEKKKIVSKISLVDSMNLLNSSLDKLTKDFNVEVKKGKFPYSFVNRLNIVNNYTGFIPEKCYYEGISESDYNKIKTQMRCKNWNLKKEAISYLKSDLISLFSVMNEFSKRLYVMFNTQMTEGLTITRLSLNIYLKNYYISRHTLNKKEIPLINTHFPFNFIKLGYFGGINEVYIPYGENLQYLDVNSLYPFAALNPMPGTNCEYIESLEGELDLNQLFGFFFAEVKTNEQYFGLLPLHLDNQLVLPQGKFSGIWSSEELKFARDNGYEIKVIKGFNFNKVEDTFTEYVKFLYDFKSKATGTDRLVCKSLLNNLIGRFGLSILKPITEIVNLDKRDFIASTRVIKSQINLNNNRFLLTYLPIISSDICKDHGIDILKALNKGANKNIENNIGYFKDVSVATTAMVNSYARIFMNKVKLDILKNGGKIYYTDTDSLVCNTSYFNTNLIGDELGQFKLEHLIKEAYFISNKTYCLVTEKGDTIIKAKGVSNNAISLEDFKTMYWNNKNIQTIKLNTTKYIQKGYVSIDNKEITLNYNSYTKREKIFSHKDETLWINTKPLTYTNM